MAKEIKLKSRYNKYNILKPISLKDKCYIFKPYDPIYRVGFDNTKDKNIKFVDPSGGPFISVDTVIPGTSKKVKSIKSVLLIEVE